jgi:hypothetical protein
MKTAEVLPGRTVGEGEGLRSKSEARRLPENNSATKVRTLVVRGPHTPSAHGGGVWFGPFPIGVR